MANAAIQSPAQAAAATSTPSPDQLLATSDIKTEEEASRTITEPGEQAATNAQTSATEATDVQTKSDQLWDKAYDDLKYDAPDLFDLYEKILSLDLGGSKDAQRNIIEQDPTQRRVQMNRLLDAGLEKTARLGSVEKNIGVAIQIVLSVKEVVGSALQAVPVAALAWTGVCVALQVSRPSTFDS